MSNESGQDEWSDDEKKKFIMEFTRVFSENDWPAVLEFFPEDMRFYTNGTHGYAGLFPGKQYFWENVLKPMVDQGDENGFEERIRRVITQGDMVAVESQGFEKLSNGKEYNNPYAWLYRLEGGRIADYIGFTDTKLISDTHDQPSENPRPTGVSYQLAGESILGKGGGYDDLSRSNVHIVHQLIDANAKARKGDVLRLLAPDVKYEIMGRSTKYSGPVRGKEKVWSDRLHPLYEQIDPAESREEVIRTIVEGPVVAVETRLQQRLRNGSSYFNEVVSFFVVENGLIKEWNLHLDTKALHESFA